MSGLQKGKNMEIEKKKYLGRNDLVSIITDERVERIGEWAFARCMSLKSIVLHDGIKEIGRNAFLGCDALCCVYLLEKEGAYHLKGSSEIKEENPIGQKPEDNDTKGGQENGPDIRSGRISGSFDGIDTCLALMRADGIRLGLCADITSMLCAHPDECDSWINEWDSSLASQLIRPADYGYEPFCAGGEEDYEEGEEARKGFVLKRSIALGTASADRLILSVFFEKGIDDEYRRTLEDYLFLSIPDKAEVFSAILTEREELLEETVRLFFESGKAGSDLAERILDTIASNRVELRSLILRYMQKSVKDPFAI